MPILKPNRLPIKPVLAFLFSNMGVQIHLFSLPSMLGIEFSLVEKPHYTFLPAKVFAIPGLDNTASSTSPNF